MKHTLLSLCTLALSLSASAQQSELGIGGGVSILSGASGNIHYKATEGATAGTLTLTYAYNLHHVYTESKLTAQTGFNVHVLKLAGESTDTFQYFGQTIGNDGKEFIYAKTAIAVTPMINMKYRMSNRTYIYGGASIGVIYGINNSNKRWQDFDGKDYTYTAPNGGAGLAIGLQAGLNQRVTQRLAVNLEVAVRRYNLHYSVDDTAYPGGFEFNYNTMAIPVTLGIRYRMGWEKEPDKSGRLRPVSDQQD
jgi:hypothetical protein